MPPLGQPVDSMKLTLFPLTLPVALIVAPKRVIDENVLPTGLMASLGTEKVSVLGLPLVPFWVPSMVFCSGEPTYSSILPLPPLKAVTLMSLIGAEPRMASLEPVPTCEPFGHAVGPCASSSAFEHVLNEPLLNSSSLGYVMIVVRTGGGCVPSSFVVVTCVKSAWPTGFLVVPTFVDLMLPETVFFVVAANAGTAATTATA